MTESQKPAAAHGWDTYWKKTQDADSYASGGERHPAITAYWDGVLPDVLAGTRDTLRVLDIATGSGAVVESLYRNAGDAPIEVTCVDVSAAAIDSVRERYPGVTAVVADARSIPLPDKNYDLVASQFGIEYAGPEALDEAARLLAPGGRLALLMHARPGLVFNECRASLDAVRRTRQAKFVQLAVAFFEAGFAAVRGADRGPYEKAGAALNPALRKVERLLAEHGEAVAGGTVARLYRDVERIHSRIQHYAPEEVLAWLQTMNEELDAYETRMASMCEAASDKKAFRGLGQRLERQRLTITRAKPLKPGGSSLPVAWILEARREA